MRMVIQFGLFFFSFSFSFFLVFFVSFLASLSYSVSFLLPNRPLSVHARPIVLHTFGHLFFVFFLLLLLLLLSCFFFFHEKKIWFVKTPAESALPFPTVKGLLKGIFKGTPKENKKKCSVVKSNLAAVVMVVDSLPSP